MRRLKKKKRKKKKIIIREEIVGKIWPPFEEITLEFPPARPSNDGKSETVIDVRRARDFFLLLFKT